ncbi:MAG: diguanylate cyclase [Rhodospirillaceae bacterium]|nr:MAG: diguanylate cyclase [Rhodospirillaceae bacterium]
MGRTSVLVVEDDSTIQALITAVLALNFDVTAVSTGKAALEHALTGNFDLILLDVGLPDIDGFSVCRQIKSDPRGRETPVIFLTSRNSAQDEVNGLEAGGIDYIAKPINPAILRARVNNHAELKHSRDTLTRLARIDSLTGLPNRRTFDDVLEREWRRLARTNSPLSLIMFDVDHFKLYNDTYGHGGGDLCLRHIAESAVSALQRPADMIARYGGEEFAAILPDTEVAGAAAVAEAIREGIAVLKIEHETSQTAPCVTVSLGLVTSVPNLDRVPETLVSMADRALYAAKASGRNRVVISSES